MKKHRVLLINDFENHGGAEVVFNLNRKVLVEDYEVDTFTGDHVKTNPINYVYNAKIKNELTQKLLEYKPDLIHVYTFYHKLSPSIFSSFKNYKKHNSEVKIISSVHDFYFLSPNSNLIYFTLKGKVRIMKNLNWKYFFFSRIDLRGLKYDLAKKIQWFYASYIVNYQSFFDQLLVPSNFSSALIFSTSKFKANVLLNPIDLSFDETAPHALESRASSLLYVGRLSKEKGLREFLNEFKFLDKKVSLTIIGDGPEEKSLRNFVLKNDLNGQVSFLGKMSKENVLKSMKAHSALVLPSVCYETAGMVLVEAAYSGMCLFAPNYGGPKEVAEICGGHILYDPYEKDGFKKAFDEWALHSDPFTVPRRDLIKIRNTYSEDAFKMNLIKYYKKALND